MQRANVMARDAHGNTCLHIAAQYCMVEILWRLMVRGGYNLLKEKNREGFTALDLCKASTAPRYCILYFLVSQI